MVEVIGSFDDLCRLCAGKIDALMAFNVFAADQRGLLTKINACLPIEVSATDSFPKVVCMECACKLDLMFEFRERCLLTAHIFEEMVSSEDARTVLVYPVPEASDDAVLMGNDDYQACEEVPCKGIDQADEKLIPIDSDAAKIDTEEKNLVLLNEELDVKQASVCKRDNIDSKEDVTLSGERSEKSQEPAKPETKIKTKSDKGVVCSECGKVCSSNYKLQEHMRRHTGEKPYNCSYNECDRSFRSKIGLAQHEASHSGRFEFSCVTCGKGFQCKSYLVAHQRVHSEAKPYPCQHCTRSFKTKQSLLDHVNRHLGVKPFLCDICGRGFITKGLCKSHQKVHSENDNRQFPCQVCQKLFVSKSYLNTHLRIHTGEKPFMCEVCGKGFLTRVDLRIHSTMHTGEKKFICETCGKAFARRDALRCHKRSHTGERPYKCNYCGQSFTQFSPMAIHKRLHTGERPYKCDICAKAFVSRSTMLAHKKKHHSSESAQKDNCQESADQVFTVSCLKIESSAINDSESPMEQTVTYAAATLNVNLLNGKSSESSKMFVEPPTSESKCANIVRAIAITQHN